MKNRVNIQSIGATREIVWVGAKIVSALSSSGGFMGGARLFTIKIDFPTSIITIYFGMFNTFKILTYRKSQFSI